MDYYNILGVPENANDEQLATAYRKLAIKHHPDKNSGNEESTNKFKKAAEAFEVLSDPHKRANYNLTRHRPRPRPTPKPKTRPKPKQDPDRAYPHNKRYPHNKDFVYRDNSKPIDLGQWQSSNKGDKGTKDLWAQSGLEEYEKPSNKYRMPKRKRPNNLIDP